MFDLLWEGLAVIGIYGVGAYIYRVCEAHVVAIQRIGCEMSAIRDLIEKKLDSHNK